MKEDWGVTSLRRSSQPCSWISEYKRLHLMKSKRNAAPWATLNVHDDEVLHVAMSHCGHYIITSSKDKSLIIWKMSEYSARGITMFKRIYFPSWVAVVQSLFNEVDSLLLVSGVAEEPIMGQVMIYSFPKCQHIKTVNCIPYDSFGSWLGNTFFIVGDFDETNYSAVVTMHSVFENTSPKYIYSDPNSNQEYLYHCKSFETCSSKSDPHKKFLFYACSRSTLVNHSLAVAVFNGVMNSSSDFERDGLLAFTLNDDDEDEHFKKSLLKNGKSYEPCDYNSYFKNIVELKAAVIGINANKDLEKVFVNCRPWISEDNPIEISMDIQLKIFDFDLNLLRTISKAEAITPSSKFFLIHVSSSSLYAISGDEKGKIHVFDSNYNIHICSLTGHTDVVSCAVISPTNNNFICSVSDDHSIMFWDMSHTKKHSKFLAC